MSKQKILTFIVFFLLLFSFFLIIFKVDTFIPSIEYKIFSYIYGFISVGFIVYSIFLDNPNLDDEKRKKNLIVVPLAFSIFYFLSISGMFFGVSSLLQHLPSQDKKITKTVNHIYLNTGRASNVHGFEVANSYFYGKVDTSKKTAESLKIGDSIILHGKENFFGFYSNKFEIK